MNENQFSITAADEHFTRREACVSGMVKQQKFWTTRELARLRECYSTMSQDELLAEFAPRSIISIRIKASEMKIRRRRDWAAIASQHVPAFTLS